MIEEIKEHTLEAASVPGIISLFMIISSAIEVAATFLPIRLSAVPAPLFLGDAIASYVRNAEAITKGF
jgi:hypothetical protein